MTDDERVKVYWHGDLVADVPAQHLVLGGGAPVYHRETQKPAYLNRTGPFNIEELPDIKADEAGATLEKLLASPNIASKRWIFEQYDSLVRTNTVVGPGASDAAIVRIKGTNKGLAVKTDCNGRYVYLNPRKGGQIAVAEAARNVVCAGGKPLAITNCLNFGNPYKPDVYWVFKEAVGGMGDACRAFNTPVTGGNVSFYNENPESAVFPTPTIGMLGLLDDIEKRVTASFKNNGDAVFLLSPAGWAHKNDIGGSEYLSWVHKKTEGDAPHFELEEEVAVQEAMLALIDSGIVKSAHDVSDGGLAVCLAESVIFSEGLGASIALENESHIRMDAMLFGEAQSRIVFTVDQQHVNKVREIVSAMPVESLALGEVSEGDLELTLGGQAVLSLSSEALKKPYETAIPAMMQTA